MGTTVFPATTLPAPPIIRKYQPEKLLDNHREILRRRVSGQSIKNIAKDLQMDRSGVEAILSSELGREGMRSLQDLADLDTKDTMRVLSEAAHQAAEVLRDMIDGKIAVSAGTQLRAAESALDRTGHGRVTKTQTSITHNGYIGETGRESLKRRAIALGYITGDIVDVTPQEC